MDRPPGHVRRLLDEACAIDRAPRNVVVRGVSQDVPTNRHPDCRGQCGPGRDRSLDISGTLHTRRVIDPATRRITRIPGGHPGWVDSGQPAGPWISVSGDDQLETAHHKSI